MNCELSDFTESFRQIIGVYLKVRTYEFKYI